MFRNNVKDVHNVLSMNDYDIKYLVKVVFIKRYKSTLTETCPSWLTTGRTTLSRRRTKRKTTCNKKKIYQMFISSPVSSVVQCSVNVKDVYSMQIRKKKSNLPDI